MNEVQVGFSRRMSEWFSLMAFFAFSFFSWTVQLKMNNIWKKDCQQNYKSLEANWNILQIVSSRSGISIPNKFRWLKARSLDGSISSALVMEIHVQQFCSLQSQVNLTHWPLGNMNEILFMHFQTDFNDWWLGHLLWNCPNMNVTGLH